MLNLFNITDTDNFTAVNTCPGAYIHNAICGIHSVLIVFNNDNLFLGSFIAGSVLPFSSEAVLAACVGPLGLDPVISITAATAGNVAGGMTCYWMGHLGNMEWIEKYFHVKKEKMDRAERFVHGRGAWMAFFAFIPILGSAISIVLGMMRANIWIVILAMTIGKILRYALLVWGVLEASALMH